MDLLLHGMNFCYNLKFHLKRKIEKLTVEVDNIIDRSDCANKNAVKVNLRPFIENLT